MNISLPAQWEGVCKGLCVILSGETVMFHPKDIHCVNMEQKCWSGHVT